jgi:hypothetical protein
MVAETWFEIEAIEMSFFQKRSEIFRSCNSEEGVRTIPEKTQAINDRKVPSLKPCTRKQISYNMSKYLNRISTLSQY